MSAPGRIETLEELQLLIAEYRKRLDTVECKAKYSSDAAKMFAFLLSEKRANGKRITKRIFMDMTGYSEDYFKILKGTKKGGLISTNCLLSVAFGLNLTYEEAVVFFYYHGRILVTDYPEVNRLNTLLFHLNDYHAKNKEPLKWLDYLKQST